MMIIVPKNESIRKRNRIMPPATIRNRMVWTGTIPLRHNWKMPAAISSVTADLQMLAMSCSFMTFDI